MLCRAFRNAQRKKRAWKELVASLDGDSWGTLYRLILSKLRTAGPAVTETMEVDKVCRVVNTLFLSKVEALPAPREVFPRHREFAVTAEEFRSFARKIAGRRTAPGPDGLPCAVWARVAVKAAEHVLWCFNRCLKEGGFPSGVKAGQAPSHSQAGRSREPEVL